MMSRLSWAGMIASGIGLVLDVAASTRDERPADVTCRAASGCPPIDLAEDLLRMVDVQVEALPGRPRKGAEYIDALTGNHQIG